MIPLRIRLMTPLRVRLMTRLRLPVILLSLLGHFPALGQESKSTAQAPIPVIEVLTSGTHTSLRGLSVVSDEVVWVSGSSGTVGKSLDGGKTWTWDHRSGL